MITQDWKQKKLHVLVESFRPMKDDDEYAAFLASIDEFGVKVPIECVGDEVIDGRHRLTALHDLADLGKDMDAIIAKSVKPLFNEWDGAGSLTDYILALNLHRRHLTVEDKAIVALELKRLIQTQISQGQRTDIEPADFSAIEDQVGGLVSLTDTSEAIAPVSSDHKRARSMAASKVGISTGTLATAERLQREAPDLFDEMKAGTVTLWSADRALKERRQEALAAEQKAKAAAIPIVAKASANSDLTVSPGDFWRLGSNVVYCGRPTDEAFRNYKFKPSDMNGPRAELCIALVYDGDTAEDLVKGQAWLLENSVLLAAVVQPVDLQGVLTNIKRDCLGTLAATIDGDCDRGEVGVNNWWATCLFGTKWDRQFVDTDQRMFYPKKDKCGDTSYAAGGRPLAFYQWITQMMTDKGDTVIVTALNDGQALFAAEGLRDVYGAESNPNKLRNIIDRWCRTHNKQAERISA